MSGQIQSGMPSTSGSIPIVGDGWVQLGGEGTKKVYFDQLSKSDQDIVLEYLLNAQFPVLIPPQINPQENGNNSNSVSGVSNNSGDFAIQLQQARHDIITTMLDGWLTSIKKVAEDNQKTDEKRVIENMAVAHHEYQKQTTAQNDGNFAMFAAGMIIVGAGVHQALLQAVPVTGVQQTSASIAPQPVNPIVSMYNQIVAPIVTDVRAELGLMGAVFAAGLQYFTVAQIAASKDESKAGPKDGAFAKGYAENVLNLVGTVSFNNYLIALVTRAVPKELPLTTERARELVAMVKIILVSSSLAMLYQAEAGKMTGIEFAGMLNGTIKFENGDLRANLVSQIKANLSLINPKEREKILTSLLEYFDGNPSLDSLADPSKVFAAIHKTLPRGQLAG